MVGFFRLKIRYSYLVWFAVFLTVLLLASNANAKDVPKATIFIVDFVKLKGQDDLKKKLWELIVEKGKGELVIIRDVSGTRMEQFKFPELQSDDGKLRVKEIIDVRTSASYKVKITLSTLDISFQDMLHHAEAFLTDNGFNELTVDVYFVLSDIKTVVNSKTVDLTKTEVSNQCLQDAVQSNTKRSNIHLWSVNAYGIVLDEQMPGAAVEQAISTLIDSTTASTGPKREFFGYININCPTIEPIPFPHSPSPLGCKRIGAIQPAKLTCAATPQTTPVVTPTTPTTTPVVTPTTPTTTPVVTPTTPTTTPVVTPTTPVVRRVPIAPTSKVPPIPSFRQPPPNAIESQIDNWDAITITLVVTEPLDKIVGLQNNAVIIAKSPNLTELLKLNQRRFSSPISAHDFEASSSNSYKLSIVLETKRKCVVGQEISTVIRWTFSGKTWRTKIDGFIASCARNKFTSVYLGGN